MTGCCLPWLRNGLAVTPKCRQTWKIEFIKYLNSVQEATRTNFQAQEVGTVQPTMADGLATRNPTSRMP